MKNKVVCVPKLTSVPRWLTLACVPNLIIVYSLLHVRDKSTVDWCALLFAAVAAFRFVLSVLGLLSVSKVLYPVWESRIRLIVLCIC